MLRIELLQHYFFCDYYSVYTESKNRQSCKEHGFSCNAIHTSDLLARPVGNLPTGSEVKYITNLTSNENTYMLNFFSKIANV